MRIANTKIIRVKMTEPEVRALIKIIMKVGAPDSSIHRLLMWHKKASKKGWTRPRLTRQDIINFNNTINKMDLKFLSHHERAGLFRIRTLARRIQEGREVRGAFIANIHYRRMRWWNNRTRTLADAMEDEGLGGTRDHLGNILNFKQAGFTKQEAIAAGYGEDEVNDTYD